MRRRTFIFGAVALGTVGAAGIGFADIAPAGAITLTKTAWTLKTSDWSSPRGFPARTHCKCSACVHHAQNEIFATLTEANDPALRAHPGCLCEPAEIQLRVETWNEVFAGVETVDRRNAAVAAKLTATTSDHTQAQPVAASSTSSLAPVSSAQSAQASGGVAVLTPVAGASTSTSPSGKTPSPSSSSPVAPGGRNTHAEAAGLSTRPRRSTDALQPWEAFGLPVAAAATGLGLLLWWRRRNSEPEEPVDEQV